MANTNEPQTAKTSDSAHLRHKNNDVPYIITLCVLLAAIIGLTTSIVIINPFAKDPEPIPAGQTELDKTITEGYYPKDEHSEEAYTHDYNYLKNMIETKTASNGEPLSDDYVYFLQTVFINLMLNYNNTEEAFNYLNTIDTTNLNNEQLVTLYSLYSIYYDKIGDEAEALKYIDYISELQNPNNTKDNYE